MTRDPEFGTQSKLNTAPIVEDATDPSSVSVALPEPLLIPNPKRFSFYVTFPDLYEMYKDAVSSYWVPQEPDFQPDVNDWNHKLGDGERRFLKHTLAFFAEADGIVNENLNLNFCAEVQYPEIRAFYNFQSAIESVHQETYANMLRTYVRDDAEFNQLLNAVHTMPCIKQKAEWAFKYMDATQRTFAERLLGFATMEGIFFSSSFASIFFMSSRGLMPGLAFANTLISRDEGLHCKFACAMFLKCVNRPSQEKIHQMMREAVAVEEVFVRDAIPVGLIGMNADEMVTYVRYCTDRLLKQVGYDPIWNAENPFEFMKLISLQVKTNFFEARTGEYARVVADKTEGKMEITDDF